MITWIVITKNLPYSPFNIYSCALLQTQYYVKNFVNESINVL